MCAFASSADARPPIAGVLRLRTSGGNEMKHRFWTLVVSAGLLGQVSVAAQLPVPSALKEGRIVHLAGQNIDRGWMNWAAEEMPLSIVYEDEECLAFRELLGFPFPTRLPHERTRISARETVEQARLTRQVLTLLDVVSRVN